MSGGFQELEVNLTGVNDSPTITAISNQSIIQDHATSALGFTISDRETAPASLQVSASSDNSQLTPQNSLALGGNAASRTITVTPAAGQTGTSHVTVTVSDGSLSATSTFTLTVTSSGPTSWQNSPVAEDVNNSGGVNNNDAFILAVELHRNGSYFLPALPLAIGGPPPFYDVNGDGKLSNADFFQVRAYLQAAAGGEGESTAAAFELPFSPLLAFANFTSSRSTSTWSSSPITKLVAPLDALGSAVSADGSSLSAFVGSPWPASASNLLLARTDRTGHVDYFHDHLPEDALDSLSAFAADIARSWASDPLHRLLTML